VNGTLGLSPTPDLFVDDEVYPVHIKAVGHIPMEKADQAIHELYRPMWSESWSIIIMEAPGILEEAMAKPHIVKRLSEAESHLELCDIDVLLKAKVIEPITEERVLGTVRVFFVVELEKKRRRLITEPHTNALELSRPLEAMLDLCGSAFITDCAADGGIQDDFPWFYGQFELPEHARNWYCFSCRGVWFRLVIIPTGGRAEPNLAHALTASLARHAAEAENAAAGACVVLTGAYIDNLAIKGAERYATSAMTRFRISAVAAGVTIGVPIPQWTREYNFLGVHINHVDKTVSLTPKTVSKLEVIASVLATHPEQVTLELLLKHLGLWVWAASVLGQIKASWYPLLKFVRRRVNSLRMDQCVRWWSSAYLAAVAVTDLLVSNPPRQCATPVHEITAFSDSSLIGWGVVILYLSSINVLAGKWHRVEDIAVLEARAFLRTIRALPHQECLCLLHMMVDNTTVVGSIRRTRCANFTVNGIVGEALGLAREKGYVVETEYVESINNIADDPSRCGCNLYFQIEEDLKEQEMEGDAIGEQREWPSVLHLDTRWDAPSSENSPNVHGGVGSALSSYGVQAQDRSWSGARVYEWDRNVEPKAGGGGRSDPQLLERATRLRSLGKRGREEECDRTVDSRLQPPPQDTLSNGRPGSGRPDGALAVFLGPPGKICFKTTSTTGVTTAGMNNSAGSSGTRLSKRPSIRDIMKPGERGL
jgi:hypothetical protein